MPAASMYVGGSQPKRARGAAPEPAGSAPLRWPSANGVVRRGRLLALLDRLEAANAGSAASEPASRRGSGDTACVRGRAAGTPTSAVVGAAAPDVSKCAALVGGAPAGASSAARSGTATRTGGVLPSAGLAAVALARGSRPATGPPVTGLPATGLPARLAARSQDAQTPHRSSRAPTPSAYREERKRR